ncbi:MAG TPA: M1 family metallopeptidase, partial [Kofleriaceae bacterium]|nr:M1 family metallopeptidase [Kofleriaceae bacterium]
HGSIEITGDLAKPATVIWVHGKGFTVHDAKATGSGGTVPLTAKSGGDFVELRAATTLAAGRWVIALDYDGAIDQSGFAGAYRQKYGDDLYVSTQFEATAARLVFPCFDEPGFKVPWQLTLDVPVNLVAISNTPALRTEPLDKDHVRVEFAKTRPLPSYLIAFAVGPWELVDAGKAKSGVQLRVVVPKGQTARGAYAAEVFPKIVSFLEDWFAIPYPYPKLDLVAVPSLRGGAMENAGMITYDSRSLLLDPLHPTWADRHSVVNVLGHETSHQWFGDLVTNAWWDDVWLNESFATWMEDTITQAFDPSWHDDQNHITTRTNAFGADSVATARKIRQPITTEDDIHNAFDGITYPKGSSVMRMFEHYIGTDVARKAIHLYLVKHADGSGTAADLIAALDEASGKKLESAFGSFLDQGGVPILETSLVCDKGKPPHVTVAQHRYLPVGAGEPGTNLWQIPVCVVYDKAGARAETCAMVEGATADVALDATACPKWSFADAGGFGYYRLAFDEAAAKSLRDVAWSKLTEQEKRSAYESIHALALDGKIGIPTLATFASKLMAVGDRYGVGDALGDQTSGTFPQAAWGPPTGLTREVPASLLPALRSRIRTVAGPLVKKLGLAPKPGESFDGEARRSQAASAAGWAEDK